MTQITHANIEGAFPALDRKKIAKPFVATGRNYLVDLDGPKSEFGCQKTHDIFTPNQLMQSFRVANDIFYFSRDTGESYLQISEVNWAARQIMPAGRFVSADLTRPKLNLPWTHALVGTYHYFANRTWGVLQYDTVLNNWIDVTATIGISDIFFITESGGRLCCLADGIASWSAIDDGMDNVPSTTTGAGAQALSLIGTLESDSDYLGIQKVSRGFLSFTSKGVMRSELIDSINPFRHLPGETQRVPLNPWCLTKISDTDVLMLSRFGLSRSADGVKFEEFQPIQNEYFKQVEIPPLESLLNGFIALNYSIARDELYVSFAQNQVASQYTKAWVLYVKRDSWGSFNRLHKGLVFVDIDDTGPVYQQAFVDELGRLCYLNSEANIQSIEAQNNFGSYNQELLQYAPYQIEGVNIMPTNCRMAGFSEVGFPDIPAYYETVGESEVQKTENSGPTAVTVEGAVNMMPTNVAVDSGLIVLGKTAQEVLLESIDSEIEVGLFRLTDDEASDELTLITNVGISCLDVSESSGSIFDDWLADYPSDVFEDWLTLEGAEDWGDAVATGSAYSQQIRGSLDGYQTFEDQLVAIDEMQVEGKTKFCTCANVGLFQSVILTADGVGDSFHLKTLELTGGLAGRI